MTHEDYMRQALALARGGPRRPGRSPWAASLWTGPVRSSVGARNRREEDKSPLAHAELAAITDACRSHGDWRLKGARLYVTLEPCPMCAGGILSARIPELYYGAKDAGFGACGSTSTSLMRTSATTPRSWGIFWRRSAPSSSRTSLPRCGKKVPKT